MIELFKIILKIELLLFFLIIISYCIFWIVLHILLYILRWYEIANNNPNKLKNIHYPDALFFFLLETGASIYLHLLNIVHNIRRYFSSYAHKIEVLKDTERNPLVLIHGYHENYGTMSYLKRKLENNFGFFNIFPVEYSTPFTFDMKKAETEFSKNTKAVLDALSGHKTDFACHSLGGLMLLSFLCKNSQYIAQINKVVLLGTPLKGSKLAVFNQNSVAENLREGSGLIASIAYDNLKQIKIYSICSSFDEFVLPYENSFLPDYPAFENIKFDCIGHMGLLMANRTINKVAMLLIE